MQDLAIKAVTMAALEAQRMDALFLGMSYEHERWQIHLNSQGMNLKDKMRIEAVLISELKRRSPEERFRIYFRGTNPAPTQSFTPKEAPPQSRQKPIPFVRKIIAVASGKGGVGKSTVSVNLAVALSELGFRVGLLDADIYGPSVTMMLAIEDTPTIDNAGKLNPCERFGVKVMSFGFFSDRQNPVLWRGPMLSKSVSQFAYDVNWGALDYLLIDSPPGTGDVQLTLIETLPLFGALIVSTPQDVALIDAHKAISMFERHHVRILGLIENMSRYRCPQCGHEDDIFGESADSLIRERGIPLLARIPLDRKLRSSADSGTPLDNVDLFKPLAQTLGTTGLQLS